MPTVQLADGRSTDLPQGEPLGSVLPPEAVAARFEGELVDLSFVPAGEGKAEPIPVWRAVGARSPERAGQGVTHLAGQQLALVLGSAKASRRRAPHHRQRDEAKHRASETKASFSHGSGY